MTEPETTAIKAIRPRREWLLRCSDNNTQLAVCAVTVNDGRVEIFGPEDDLISLESAQIAEFHAALHEAIDLAETDLQTRRRGRTQGC